MLSISTSLESGVMTIRMADKARVYRVYIPARRDEPGSIHDTVP